MTYILERREYLASWSLWTDCNPSSYFFPTSVSTFYTVVYSGIPQMKRREQFGSVFKVRCGNEIYVNKVCWLLFGETWALSSSTDNNKVYGLSPFLLPKDWARLGLVSWHIPSPKHFWVIYYFCVLSLGRFTFYLASTLMFGKLRG